MSDTIQSVLDDATRRVRNSGDPNWLGVLRDLGVIDSLSPAGGYTCVLPASAAEYAELRRTTEVLSRYVTEDALVDAVHRQLARSLATAEQAANVFESYQRAHEWLWRPNRVLSGDVPAALLDSEQGYERVQRILSRIDHGIFS